MTVKELGHLVLFVRDLKASAHFYRDVLGFPPAFPDSSGADQPARSAVFSTGRTHHELLLIEVGDDLPPASRSRRVGMYHFGLKVGDSDEELRDVLARLKEADVRILGASDHTVTHSLYILDPDDNELEVYIDVPGIDWTDRENFFQPVRALSL